MLPFLHHWLWQDLWVPVWPNWFAGAIVGILAFIWGKKELLKLHTKIDKNHTELKAHITKTAKK